MNMIYGQRVGLRILMKPCRECNGLIHLEIGPARYRMHYGEGRYGDDEPEDIGVWQHVQFTSETRPRCLYSERQRGE